jgi:hypothetical protein
VPIISWKIGLKAEDYPGTIVDSGLYFFSGALKNSGLVDMSDSWTGIVAVAGRALMTKVPGQLEPHKYAHDCAMRIVRTLEKLVKAMPASERPRRVDLVRIAALYACVGMDHKAFRGHRHNTHHHEALDDAAEMAADHLQNLLPVGDIDLTLRILKEYKLKQPKTSEAKLLADAISLEDVGIIGLWNQTRGVHGAGRSLEHLIKFWKTQKEYGYWEARLRDGFHFEISRKVAKKRLELMAPMFDRMLHEHLGEDIH